MSSYLSSKIEFLPKKLSRGLSNPDFFGFTDCFLKAEVDLNNIKVPGKGKKELVKGTFIKDVRFWGR